MNALPVCSYASEKGLLFTRNFYPPLLLFLQIPNDTGLDIKEGSGYFETMIGHANVFSGEATSEGRVRFDMELTRLLNRVVYRITERFTTGMEIPFLYLWNGFLDGQLQNFHNTFGLPNQNRENSDDYSYRYRIDKRENLVRNQGKKVFGMGDLSVFINYDFLNRDDFYPDIGVIAALKFPSGDAGLMHGSGKYDFGVGLKIDQSIGGIVLHSVTGLVWPGKPDVLTGIDVKPFLTESIAIEYIYSTPLSLIVQLDFNSNPYSSGISKLDKESLELVMGFKRSVFERYLWHFSFTENLTADTITDFTMQTGIGINF